MKGVLQEVSGSMVKISDKYYDASQVIHFLPQSVNIEVEFSVNNEQQLTYIRSIGSQKKTNQKFTSKKMSRFRSNRKSLGKSSFDTNQSGQGEKIARQLLLKIADNKTNTFSHGSIEEALEALDQVYQTLKQKYLDELK